MASSRKLHYAARLLLLEKMMKPLLATTLALLLAACGCNNDVTYRFEQNDPARQNTIGITNAGGETQAYGSIGVSAHTGN